MKKLCVFLVLLLLLTACAASPEPLPEQAQLGEILSIAPSYETRYFSRTMGLLQDSETRQAFQTAYEQALSAVTETSGTIPEGDQFFFRIYHKQGEATNDLYLRLVDDGEGCWLELSPRLRKPEWALTYTLSREAAQPLLDFFADEPTGKPHIEGAPNGRVVPLLERVEWDWPIFEGTVTEVSDAVQEYSLHEGLRYGWLYREFTVEVTECYSGNLTKGTKLTYRMFGGENEDYRFSVPNAPQVAVGDYVIIAAKEHSFVTEYDLFPAERLNEYQSTFTPPVGLFPVGDGLLSKTYYTSQLRSLVDGRYNHDLDDYRASRENLPERVSERELAELRIKYPRQGDFFSPLASRMAINDWDDALIFDDADGLAVLDFTGEYRILGSKQEDGIFYEGAALNDPLAQGSYVLFARVEEVLIGCDGLQAGELVPVLVSVTHITSLEHLRLSLFGQHYLCLVTMITPEHEGGNYYLPDAIAADELLRFYLTPDDVVLYTGFEGDTVLDECSGMYLPAFTELIREKLFSGE